MSGILTARDVAERLGLSRTLVLRYMAAGRIRATRISEGRTSPWVTTEEALAEFASRPRKPGNYRRER